MNTTPTVVRSAAVALGLALCAAAPDPGVRVHVDLEHFELIAVDTRKPDDAALVLPIATGSPSHPSPPGHYRAREVVRAWARILVGNAGRLGPGPGSPAEVVQRQIQRVREVLERERSLSA